MQKFAGSCSPEKLHTLQKIFDLIWMELRASTASTFNGSSDPDALRNEIARRVLGNYKGAEIDADQITRRVLSSLGIKTGVLPSGDIGSLERTAIPFWKPPQAFPLR
jgi:hypothetical protein